MNGTVYRVAALHWHTVWKVHKVICDSTRQENDDAILLAIYYLRNVISYVYSNVGIDRVCFILFSLYSSFHYFILLFLFIKLFCIFHFYLFHFVYFSLIMYGVMKFYSDGKPVNEQERFVDGTTYSSWDFLYLIKKLKKKNLSLNKRTWKFDVCSYSHGKK